MCDFRLSCLYPPLPFCLSPAIGRDVKKPHGDCVMNRGEGGIAAGFDAVAGGFNKDAKGLLVCKVHHLALTLKHIQAAALQTETRIGKVVLVRRSVDGIDIPDCVSLVPAPLPPHNPFSCSLLTLPHNHTSARSQKKPQKSSNKPKNEGHCKCKTGKKTNRCKCNR